LNPHGYPRDPKSRASASSATLAGWGMQESIPAQWANKRKDKFLWGYFVPLDVSHCQPILLRGESGFASVPMGRSVSICGTAEFSTSRDWVLGSG